MANTEQPVDFGGLSEKRIQQFKEKAEKSKAKRDAYEKSVRAKYEKQKAAFDAQPAAAKSIQSMVHGGFRPRVTGLANLKAGHYRTEQAVLDKFAQEDRKKRIQEMAAKQRAQKAAKPAVPPKPAPAAAKPAPAAAKPTYVPAKPAVPAKPPINVRKGGAVKFSASKRSDGIAQRGKTKGRYV